MGKVSDAISDKLAEWMIEQPVFFVATAPLAADGLINCSPKGLKGSFVVIDDKTVAYLDVTGSGIETVAHIRENNRIVIMFCAFDGSPNIVRLHGRGKVVVPGDPDWESLVARFPERPGIRAVIVNEVQRVSESCGFGVPLMDYVGDRDVLDRANAKKGEAKLAQYRTEKNTTSIDGLPGLSTQPE